MACVRAAFLNVLNLLNWAILGDGAALCIVECLSITLVSSYWILVAHHLPSVFRTIKNISRHGWMKVGCSKTVAC